MNVNKLEELLSDYNEMTYLNSVIYGCDCGCGGDGYSSEDWHDIMDHGEAAKKELEEFGVTFG